MQRDSQTQTYQKGKLSEKIAMLWLMMKGWRPIARNFKIKKGTGAGEVDLIMVRWHTLIFVEVKYRQTLRQALEAISIQQQIRVSKGASVFLSQYPQYRGYQMRFDAVCMAPKRWPHHIPNAWQIM